MTEFTASQKRKYLARILRLNPVHEANKILALRAELLGQSDSGQREVADISNLQELRNQAHSQIAEIREQIWKLQPARLSAMVQAIEIGQMPELKTAVLRLRLVATHHTDFLHLFQHPNRQINLTNTFKRVVMLPPKEAGALKESYLRKIVESPDLKAIQAMVRMMENEFPAL